MGCLPAGGGDYWSICNWYVVSNNLFFHDSLIKVSSGTHLYAEIKLTSQLNNRFNYNSKFLGYSSGLQIDNLPQLEAPQIVLEGYNIADCKELPIDEKIRFFNLKIISNSEFPPLIWFTSNKDNPCDIFSEIVNESSQNGEVAIHFHKPFSVDNFNEIHIYPNPLESFLHISPNKTLYNCYVKVYSSTGCLIFTNYYQFFDNEVKLDLSFIRPGLYIIRFFYYHSTNSTTLINHSFKIIKK